MKTRQPWWKEHLWGPPNTRQLRVLPEILRSPAARLRPGQILPVARELVPELLHEMSRLGRECGDFLISEHHSDFFLRSLVAVAYIPENRLHPFWRHRTGKKTPQEWAAYKRYQRKKKSLQRRGMG